MRLKLSFGVCCLFTVDECGAKITNNQTYVRNPNFPGNYDDGSTSCDYTIEKIDDGICTIRLDFESFQTHGPSDTTEDEDAGGVCQDPFSVTGTTTGQNVPVICGLNAGYHMYVDMNYGVDEESIRLNFDFAGTLNTLNRGRLWDIKVSQIPCHTPTTPPAGCLQYFWGGFGRIETYNFQDTTNMGHLINQQYSNCIRTEEDMCCVEYRACDEEHSFSPSLDSGGPPICPNDRLVFHGMVDSITTDQRCRYLDPDERNIGRSNHLVYLLVLELI